MAQPTLHPDLSPKKVLGITVRPWNIGLFRLLERWVLPRPKRIDGVETVVSAVGGVQRRIHRPIGPSAPGALLWMHGGGLIIGTPSQEDGKLAKLASALGITVIALPYRLAPQRPFPIPIDDCMAGWTAVQDHAEALGIDPTRVAIGGTSAGGGLAACLALKLRDQGGIQPIAQVLVYPMLDDRTTMRAGVGLSEHPVWNQRSNITGWSAYLGPQRGADTLPDYAAAARHTDLAGLPPTWIGIGTLDLLHDEDVDYAARLQSAGVATTLHVIDGAYHAFDVLDVDSPVSREFFQMQVGFLKSILATVEGPG